MYTNIDEAVISVSDFTVQIKGVPKMLNEQQLEDLIC